MSVFNQLVSFAGKVGFHVKDFFQGFSHSREKSLSNHVDCDALPPYGKNAVLNPEAQMNDITCKTKILIDGIRKEKNKILSQVYCSESDNVLVQNLNQKENELMQERRRIMDFIRSEFGLPAGCDLSSPNWRL